jgi:hypothetical protein
MTLASRVRAVFRRAWQRYGKPTMTIVPPLADWSLPAGYSFDPSRDGIVTGGGATLTDLDALSEYYAAGVVYIVPLQASDDLRAMRSAGIAPDGQIEVYVLAADIPTVQAAFAVQVGGLWFNVVSPAVEPSGAADIWARVRLERRS